MWSRLVLEKQNKSRMVLVKLADSFRWQIRKVKYLDTIQ